MGTAFRGLTPPAKSWRPFGAGGSAIASSPQPVPCGSPWKGEGTGSFRTSVLRAQDTRGQAREQTELVARREGKEEVLGEAKPPLSGGQKTLGVSAVGRHWKGFADGKTVVHGHTQLSGAGHVAFLLDGIGTVRLLSVRISPVNTGEAPPKADERDSHEH